MDTIINFPRRFTLYAVAMALAGLVITLLAVNMTAGPAQAQTPDANNNYANPKPCGPGAEDAFQPEPHEVTEGHIAFFDSYWEWRGDSMDVGVLHTNMCPPKMEKTTKRQGQATVEVTTRTESHLDVDEAIIHVKDVHHATVVATNAEATSGQLSLQEYPRVGKAAEVGDKVWWLRLNDPDTDADETSDLSLGFSTELLDPIYWFTEADGKPMRYMFETERYPGSDPQDVPHFFTYEAPLRNNGEQEDPVWDSTEVHVNPMLMDPGEYRPVQWVFTKPGTYILSVHLLGHVRDADGRHPDAGEGWKPASGNKTETGEVRRYTIQVGDTLEEMEPPTFGVNFDVDENSPGGTKVGDPILVYDSEADALDYKLSGKGHANFSLVPATEPHSVQVVVSDGADLDYEKKTSYDLRLSVSDNIDHENNPDPVVDDVLAVQIDINDIVPAISMSASNSNPQAGETVVFTMKLTDVPANGRRGGITFNLNKRDEFDVVTYERGTVDPRTLIGTVSTSESYAHSVEYWATVSVLVQTYEGAHQASYATQPVTLAWTE